MPCSNAAKKQNPLKFAGVPQTRQQISAVSRPKFTISSGHVEEVLLLNKFFFWLSIHALVANIWPDRIVRWCPDGDFLRPVFAASRVQRISDLHSKFALRPHHVPKYGKHPISYLRPLRLGEEKKERKKKEETGWKYNGLPYYIGRP